MLLNQPQALCFMSALYLSNLTGAKAYRIVHIMIYCLCRNFKSLLVLPSMMELSCLHIGLGWRMCASISDRRILLKLQISVSSEAPMTRDFYSFSSKTLFSSSFEFPKTLIAKEISLPSVSQQQWAPIAVSSHVPCLPRPSLT